ncbi:MAG: hypothetical protein ACE5H1_08980 [Thermodesulfobacteriota bacterium]
MCIELDLIEGNVLFVDGSKIRANAARGKNYTKAHYGEKLSGIDRNVEKLECQYEQSVSQEIYKRRK